MNRSNRRKIYKPNKQNTKIMEIVKDQTNPENKISIEDYQNSFSTPVVLTVISKLGQMQQVPTGGFTRLEDIFLKIIINNENDIFATTFKSAWEKAEQICNFLTEKRNEAIKKNNSDSNHSNIIS